VADKYGAASVYCVMKQVYAIGDIHGGLKALNELLELLPLQPKDRLVFLGDYVDGWSESAGVIERLMALQQQYECIFIVGNHDKWCSKWLKDGSTEDLWLTSGGWETINSYDNVEPEIRAKHLEFFERMPNYFIDEDKNLFIHAGFSSIHGPQHDRYETNHYWDRTLLETALALDPLMQKDNPFYPKRLKHFNSIFIGHTPTTNFNITEPVHAANLWNVDTGAAFYGPLTGIRVSTGEFWQSNPVHSFYPEEKGRNK
jgi:serine/threonine protein phosphatase 1